MHLGTGDTLMAGMTTSHHPQIVIRRGAWDDLTPHIGNQRGVLPCQAKMQYLLTLQVSKYCIVYLQSCVVMRELPCTAMPEDIVDS